MATMYQRAVRLLERTLLSKGRFNLTYLVRFCNNLILNFIFMFKSLFPVSKNKNMGGGRYYFARLELGFMLLELFPLISRGFSQLYLYKNTVELLTNPKKINNSYSSKFKQSKILIVGPGNINFKSIVDYDIQILLNPNLKVIQLGQDMNYIIVLNKQNTERYLDCLDELSSRSNILSIYTKIRFSDFKHNKKIKFIDPTFLIEIAPTSGTPNLLQLILFEISHWSIKQIQVVGCDMFLGEYRYRPGIKPTYMTDDVSRIHNFLISLSWHNPFAQLSLIKTFEVYFTGKGIQFITELNEVRYLKMASTYKNMCKPSNSIPPAR